MVPFFLYFLFFIPVVASLVPLLSEPTNAVMGYRLMTTGMREVDFLSLMEVPWIPSRPLPWTRLRGIIGNEESPYRTTGE